MLNVSAGVVVSKSKVLCFQKGQSKFDYLTNKYEFPGGKIESNESPEQTLIREFNEELQANVKQTDLKLLCESTYNYPDFSVKIYAFIINIDNFEYILTEHQQAVWLSIDELDSLDWAEADKAIVQKLKEIL